MVPPNEISFDSINIGERARTTYNRIEELAQSIKDNGLIQPVVLVPLPKEHSWNGASEPQCQHCMIVFGESGSNAECLLAPVTHFGLDAGGRRYQALKLLETKVLHHATTSDPTRPGYVLKGEDQASPLKRLFTEIAENLDRDDLEWRDEMRVLTKAYRLVKADADAVGERILMRDFGATLGVGYAELQAAVAIHDDVVVNPDRYKDCTGIRAAYGVLLKHNAEELNKLAATKSLSKSPLKESEPVVEVSGVRAQNGPELSPKINIPLTESFFNKNAQEFMSSIPMERFDHIITDPDYGVSVERLSASVGGASAGVVQSSVADSLSDMDKFIKESWRLIKPQGFLVFFYDLDHHEKLQTMATNVGFAVQRWPLIWVKSDYRSNSAPAYNFCKNIEYAMVCRKPNAVLARAQMSSVFQCASGEVVRDFGHPFAKPIELWQWIYSAVCIKGQVVYDPFVGRGSSAVASIRWGLRPIGSEISVDHYAGLILNLQKAFRKELGNDVTFS